MLLTTQKPLSCLTPAPPLQPSTAAPLVIESMSATELAVLCHVLLLLGEVLAPENRAHNGLSPASLAAILAEVSAGGGWPLSNEFCELAGRMQSSTGPDAGRRARD